MCQKPLWIQGLSLLFFYMGGLPVDSRFHDNILKICKTEMGHHVKEIENKFSGVPE